MQAVLLATLTLVAATNARYAWRAARSAPHQLYRRLMRVLVVVIPVYLLAGWLALLSSGTIHRLWVGMQIVAGVPMALAAVGVPLVMATAPSRRPK